MIGRALLVLAAAAAGGASGGAVLGVIEARWFGVAVLFPTMIGLWTGLAAGTAALLLSRGGDPARLRRLAMLVAVPGVAVGLWAHAEMYEYQGWDLFRRAMDSWYGERLPAERARVEELLALDTDDDGVVETPSGPVDVAARAEEVARHEQGIYHLGDWEWFLRSEFGVGRTTGAWLARSSGLPPFDGHRTFGVSVGAGASWVLTMLGMLAALVAGPLTAAVTGPGVAAGQSAE